MNIVTERVPSGTRPTWSWHQIRQPHIGKYEAGGSGANFTLVHDLLTPNESTMVVYDVETPTRTVSSVVLRELQAAMVIGLKM